MSESKGKAEQFSTFVAEFGHGELDKTLSKRLADLVTACRDTGKAGKLVLTMAIKPEGKMAGIGFAIKTTTPEPAMPGQIYFTNEDGDLFTEDPRQLKLPVKVIDVPEPGPLRTVK